MVGTGQLVFQRLTDSVEHLYGGELEGLVAHKLGEVCDRLKAVAPARVMQEQFFVSQVMEGSEDHVAVQAGYQGG